MAGRDKKNKKNKKTTTKERKVLIMNFCPADVSNTGGEKGRKEWKREGILFWEHWAFWMTEFNLILFCK